MKRFAFTTDVEKMYRQILIHDKHQQYQLIVWRKNPNDKLEIYKLKTVTYGTRCAPYLATRCLKALADSNASTYPLGSEALVRDFYVDDGLIGADTVTEAIRIKQELTTILASAGFKLRKWCANDAKLLAGIPPEDKEIELDFKNKESKNTIKTLGVLWLPKSDELCIRTSTQHNMRITKRTVTSELAQIYDPLGLVAPVIVKAKCFIQGLWQLKLDWDEILPTELQKRWSDFRDDLLKLDDVKIIRHVMNHKLATHKQLHVFTDASQKAYGAAIYIRVINKDGTIAAQLLCAKTRVSPLKMQTIPRLELCAALLGAKLAKRVRIDLNMQNEQTYIWSDSEIVLHWINSEPSKYQTFVAHRIAQIQELTVNSQWRHVPSKSNPADLLSRGISAREIKRSALWLHGPLFLHGNENQWPPEFNRESIPYQSTEERSIKSVLFISTKDSFVNMMYHIDHRNSWSYLQHTVGYMLRFIAAIRSKDRAANEALSPEELNKATTVIIKAIQASEFSDEIKLLSSSKFLCQSHSLSSLSPFLDSDGLIRVGGRLHEANLPYDARHPILLPYNDTIVKILIQNIHESNLHCGPQALLANVRQRFWPIKGKIMARSIVQKCVRCTRIQPKLYTQIMGNLPQDRVTQQRPFFNCGVDFCGPIWIHYKLRGKRPCKSYICVFCCFATKAVHLEIVSDLTTDAFLGALNRFTSRRGRCQRIYCDNATNFVGARNQLVELEQVIYGHHAQNNISRYCTDKGIEFNFIPPRAPHFGGLWEAAVKSAKNLLIRSIGNASLTYEELETVVVQIEGILNSRPITPISSNPNDLTALTPGHFLIGEPITACPNVNTNQNKSSLVKRWRLVNQLKNEFWERWSKEYLNELQHRNKWKTNATNVESGTLVILKEDNLAPLQWPLGRITRTYEGNDGYIRVVDVKTSTGEIRRPIHRLAPLFPENTLKRKSNDEVEQQTVTSDNVDNNKVSIAKRPKSNLILATITILLCLPLMLCSNVEVIQLPNRPGIFFDDIGKTVISTTQWNMFIYYDLNPMKANIRNFSNGTSLLQQLCSQKGWWGNKICNSVIAHLLEAKEEFEIENKLFQSNRSKRGAVDVIGNVAHTLFGVLDSEYAKEMSQTIEKINQREEYEFELIKNQTSIIDATINVMKNYQTTTKTKFNEIVKVLNDLNNHIVNEEKAIEKIESQEMLLLLTTELTLMMIKIHQTQTLILNVLTDAQHGQISPLLLTPPQFRKEMLKIKENLPQSVRFPVAQDDLLAIYKLMSVEAGLTRDHVLFKVQLPLIGPYDLRMYNIIPITAAINGSFITIKPSFDVLAINSHGDSYYPLTNEERKTCSKMAERSYICPLSRIINHKGSPVGLCEVNFFNNETNLPCNVHEVKTDLWTQLTNKNTWVFAVKEPIKFTAVCNNGVEQFSVHGSGVLKLNADCTIKNKFLTLHGQSNITSRMSLSFFSHADMNQILDIHTSQPIKLFKLIKPYDADLQELMKVQTKLKNEQIFQLPDKFQKTTSHMFGVTYSIIAIMFILAVYKGVQYWRFKRTSPANGNVPVPLPRTVDDDFTIRV